MKARKRYNELTWGTPKMVVLAETEVPDEPRRMKKRSKVCKFYKSEHQFERVRRKWISGCDIEENVCACGKKNWKGTRFINLEKEKDEQQTT
jgi:hypothetical protein